MHSSLFTDAFGSDLPKVCTLTSSNHMEIECCLRCVILLIYDVLMDRESSTFLLFLQNRHTAYFNNFDFLNIKSYIVWQESLANHLWFAKLKLLHTINHLMADLFICQTVFTKCWKRTNFWSNLWKPNIMAHAGCGHLMFTDPWLSW